VGEGGVHPGVVRGGEVPHFLYRTVVKKFT
jgi:hypothetical protein